ncbi:MAG: Ig-like domain-containing protein [Pirellulaceae bacterium]
MVRGKILRRRTCSFDQLEDRRVLDGAPLVGGVTFPYDDVDRLVIDDVLGPDLFMDDGFAPIDHLTLLTPNDPVSNSGGISLPTSSFDRFPLEQIQDRFFLFDNMAPYNAPDFAGEYGLAPLRLFTQWFFWPVGAGPEPDIERLLSKIPHLDARQPVVVDIEHWPTAVSDSDEELRESVRKLTTILDTIKQQRPDVTVGLYRTVPTREYRAPVFHGMDSPEYALWQAHNSERVAEIAKHVDIIVPSLYTFYPDYERDGSLRLFERDRWVTYATANIEEARQYGKPVVPYILPYYTPSSLPDRYWQSAEISPGFWETILNTVHDQADSAVIWTGRYEWADNPGWWPVTEQFANDVLPVMTDSESTVLGQVEFGSYWQTRGSEAATIRIEVNPINDAPNAKNDTVTRHDFLPITLDLLANNGFGADSDIDGTIIPSSLVINTLPSHGQVENHLDGTVTYAPNGNHIGADTFTYTISDNNGAISNSATVTINTIVNRPPVAVNDLITVNKNSQVTFHVANSDTLGVDSDPDGNLDRTSPVVVTGPLHVAVVKNTADGSFTYTPHTGFLGTIRSPTEFWIRTMQPAM